MTSIHDFFGAGVVQAIYCDTWPLLPMRLAYPEHLPQARHGEFFYDDFEDLVARLAELCRGIEGVRRMPTRSLVARYDWAALAPDYDALFAHLARGGTFAVDSGAGLG